MKCDLATPQVTMKPDSFTFPFDQQIASTLQYCSCTKILYKYRWNTRTRYNHTSQVHIPGKLNCNQFQVLVGLMDLICIFVAVWLCGDLNLGEIHHTPAPILCIDATPFLWGFNGTQLQQNSI